ncbi:MAG: hypothetical protein NVS1B13_17250 [Flavisolibacter sp.]
MGESDFLGLGASVVLDLIKFSFITQIKFHGRFIEKEDKKWKLGFDHQPFGMSFL